MRQVMDAVGGCKLEVDRSPFRMLIRSVTGQQLSVAAARTIWGRVLALNGSKRVSPASLSRVSDQQLRSAGVSRAKIRSIREIQTAFERRDITGTKLRRQSDEEVKKTLIQIRGIGPWTADMFLMFALGRLDVFPIGDLGIVNALQQLYGNGKQIDSDRMYQIAHKWQPYSSVASWYCWQALDLIREGNLRMV